MCKGKIKKSSVVILAALSLLAGGFSTAYAQEIETNANAQAVETYVYKFIIVRNVTAKDQVNGVEQVWKQSSSDLASVRVTSASSPSSWTTYKIFNYDDPVTNPMELKNSGAYAHGYVKYKDTAKNGGFPVNIRGIDNRGTAPNYSTVEGIWSPNCTIL